MNKKFCDKILEVILKSQEMKMAVAYTFIVCMIFANLSECKNLPFAYAVITLYEGRFLCYFIYPVIVLFGVMIIRVIKNNLYSIRLIDNKTIIKNAIYINFKFINIYIVILFFFITISLNFFVRPIFKTAIIDIVKQKDIYVLFAYILKIYMMANLLQLINLHLINKYNKNNINIMLMLILLFFISESVYINTNKKILYLLPSTNLFSYIFFDSVKQSLLYSTCYYIIAYSIVLSIIKINYRKKRRIYD